MILKIRHDSVIEKSFIRNCFSIFLSLRQTAVFNQTLQAFPSKPIVTLPSSIITGTLRTPFDIFSIDSSFPSPEKTLIYSYFFPLLEHASRAAVVKGQVSFPYIMIFSAIITSLSDGKYYLLSATGFNYGKCNKFIQV
jgi:hypothetical protein